MVLRIVAALVALAWVYTGHAAAAPVLADEEIDGIFSAGNAGRLCQKGVVSKLELADMIRGLSGLPLSKVSEFDLASQSGGSLEGGLIRFASVERPFGENAVPKEFEVAIGRRNDLIPALRRFFNGGGNKLYKVVPAGTSAFEFFTASSSTRIDCVKSENEGNVKASGAGASGKDFSKEIADRVVVRKTIADLAISKEKLKKANGALLSFTDDDFNNSTTYAIDGLIGFVLAGSSVDRTDKIKADTDSYWFNLTPYFFYKHTDVNPDTKTSKDIDVMQPGMVGNLTWISSSGRVALDVQGDANYIIDRAQDSRLLTTTLRVAPSFLHDGILLPGAPIDWGILRVTPNVALLAREYIVEREGANKELKGKASFSSFGADSSLKFGILTKDSVLSGFEFTVAYFYLANTNGVEDIGHLTSSLSYSPPQLENVSLDLTYDKGRDERTLQKEREWFAGLAFRY